MGQKSCSEETLDHSLIGLILSIHFLLFMHSTHSIDHPSINSSKIFHPLSLEKFASSQKLRNTSLWNKMRKFFAGFVYWNSIFSHVLLLVTSTLLSSKLCKLIIFASDLKTKQNVSQSFDFGKIVNRGSQTVWKISGFSVIQNSDSK